MSRKHDYSRTYLYASIASQSLGQIQEKYQKEKSGAENALERHSGLFERSNKKENKRGLIKKDLKNLLAKKETKKSL